MSNKLLRVLAAVGALALAGCDDSTAPRDTTPPAGPRGLHSITGDHEVFLKWLENTEPDVVGYRIYQAPCAAGNDCPYDRVAATTGTDYVVRGLPNGVTRYFAVSAFDEAGNESRLSREEVFDTPRPEGFGLALDNYRNSPATSGYDFSAYAVRAFNDSTIDIFYGAQNGVALMYAPFADTEIQDAGYAGSLDAIDYAPSTGWSPSGTVELIDGHCYVVLTHENHLAHYAKFRVTNVSATRVELDWAYQVDPGNRELKAKPVRAHRPRTRRALSLG